MERFTEHDAWLADRLKYQAEVTLRQAIDQNPQAKELLARIEAALASLER